MKKLALGSVLFLMGYCGVFAQKNYNTGIGLRFGYAYGLTVKHFINDKWAIEGILSSRGLGRGWGNSGGFNLAGLGEYHGAIGGVKGLAWYLGLGAHLGYWSWASNHRPNGYKSDRVFVLGLDAIAGIEYTIPSAPFTFSLDWKPEFDLIGGSRFWGDGLALSVRFAIK